MHTHTHPCSHESVWASSFCMYLRVARSPVRYFQFGQTRSLLRPKQRPCGMHTCDSVSVNGALVFRLLTTIK